MNTTHQRIVNHLKRAAPYHLQGYLNGWLEVVPLNDNLGYHIFSKDDNGERQIVTTIIN